MQIVMVVPVARNEGEYETVLDLRRTYNVVLTGDYSYYSMCSTCMNKYYVNKECGQRCGKLGTVVENLKAAKEKALYRNIPEDLVAELRFGAISTVAAPWKPRTRKAYKVQERRIDRAIASYKQNLPYAITEEMFHHYMYTWAHGLKIAEAIKEDEELNTIPATADIRDLMRQSMNRLLIWSGSYFSNINFAERFVGISPLLTSDEISKIFEESTEVCCDIKRLQERWF